MGNKTSKTAGQINYRKSSKLKKQKIDQTSRWRGFGLCPNHNQQEEQWLSHFKNECSDLIDSCQWASQVLYSLKKYEGYPVSHYQREVLQCNFPISRGSMRKETTSTKKKNNFDNLTPQTKYKKLYKKSDLIEEDMNNSISLSSSLIGNVVSGNLIGGNNNNKKSSSINSFSINNPHPNKGSFSSFNSNPSYVFPQYLLHKNDIINQNKEQIDALELYVLKTEVIAKHLQDQNNILGHLCFQFLETFINSFEGISQRLRDLRIANLYSYSEEKEIVNKAINEVQQFIRVMQETIELFYNLNREIKRSNSESKKQPIINHFNRENMLNFITSQIFKNKKLYQIMFTLLSLEDLDQEMMLQSSMKKLLNKRPQDFYIQDRLCLNERTLQFYKKDSIKFIQEEYENDCTGTESLNQQNENESNSSSTIQQTKKIEKKYQSNHSLKEEDSEQENEEDDSLYSKKFKKDKHQQQQQQQYENENEEEKQSYMGDDDDNDFNSSHQLRAQSTMKNESQSNSKLRKTKTQDFKNDDNNNNNNNNSISHQPTNCSTTSPSNNNNPNNNNANNISHSGNKSNCKEVEYYYTSSFENQSELFRESNLNNSQPQSVPFSSKTQNLVRGYSDFDQPINEKVTEENHSETSSSIHEDSKESSSSQSQQNNSNSQEEKKENTQNNNNNNNNNNQDEPDKLYFEKLKKESYYRSLKYIMRIQKQQSPIGKMKMIVKASEHILTCINSFYKKYNIQQNNFLDADDVLSIFSFFACKCYIYEMNTHIKLIGKFITSNLLNSVSGYYLTTLSASLQNLLEFQNGSILQSIAVCD